MTMIVDPSLVWCEPPDILNTFSVLLRKFYFFQVHLTSLTKVKQFSECSYRKGPSPKYNLQRSVLSQQSCK